MHLLPPRVLRPAGIVAKALKLGQDRPVALQPTARLAAPRTAILKPHFGLQHGAFREERPDSRLIALRPGT